MAVLPPPPSRPCGRQDSSSAPLAPGLPVSSPAGKLSSGPGAKSNGQPQCQPGLGQSRTGGQFRASLCTGRPQRPRAAGSLRPWRACRDSLGPALCLQETPEPSPVPPGPKSSPRYQVEDHCTSPHTRCPGPPTGSPGPCLSQLVALQVSCHLLPCPTP